MPIDSLIDKNTGILIRTVTREIHFEEIRSSFEESLKLSNYAILYPVLWDIRNANLLKINERDFIKISDYYESHLENRTILKAALVVADDFEFGLFNLFELYTTNLPTEIQVFKSFDGAKKWLLGYRAKELLKKAEAEEEKRHIKLGRFVEKKLLNEKFNPSDLPILIEKAKQIMTK